MATARDAKRISQLAGLRLRTGLSQSSAAAALGVTQQALSRLETGFCMPSASTIFKMHKLYRSSWAELMNAIRKTGGGRKAAAA
ncbi:MAG TPA: helix-turn-helix transcriptional regulator [Polyangia bacterium]|nr:helix-turn-helix transcriptional regulator [Polyangia bacterium]